MLKVSKSESKRRMEKYCNSSDITSTIGYNRSTVIWKTLNFRNRETCG